MWSLGYRKKKWKHKFLASTSKWKQFTSCTINGLTEWSFTVGKGSLFVSLFANTSSTMYTNSPILSVNHNNTAALTVQATSEYSFSWVSLTTELIQQGTADIVSRQTPFLIIFIGLLNTNFPDKQVALNGWKSYRLSMQINLGQWTKLNHKILTTRKHYNLKNLRCEN